MTEKVKKPERYLKMYIAILDEVPDYMAITLALHTILNAADEFVCQDSNSCKDTDYLDWRQNSYRKVTVRVNRKEFEKIKNLNCYLGHENTTLGGEKTCAVVYPVWSDKVPNVLKHAKMWAPKVPSNEE